MRTAWDAGIRYFDTAPWYGRGLSELRVGAGLRDRPRDEFVLSTKVGRWLRADGPESLRALRRGSAARPTRWSSITRYDGIMRAYEQSQLRLGLARYDLAFIHDLDEWYHLPQPKMTAYFMQLATSGWRALEELRSGGLLRGVGAGINHVGLIPRFLERWTRISSSSPCPTRCCSRTSWTMSSRLCVERGVGWSSAPYSSRGSWRTGGRGVALRLCPANPGGH